MVTNHGTIKFRWKSPTQITKVADTNHLDMSRCLRQTPWQVRDKPICVSLMEFSPLQCTGKVDDKVRDKVCKLCRGHKSLKSATWFVSWTFMICVRDKSVTLSVTCPGLVTDTNHESPGRKSRCRLSWFVSATIADFVANFPRAL